MGLGMLNNFEKFSFPSIEKNNGQRQRGKWTYQQKRKITHTKRQ